MTDKPITVLGIESSCDDTSAAVIRDGLLLSNVIASQKVHEEYGGVVPELASRAHQQNIVPVVDAAIKRAGVDKHDLSAIAFTRGPGLLGSLLVGTSLAKGLSLGLRVPIVDVNHLHGHVLSHFVRKKEDDEVPEYPFLCLLVSGGNSQLIMVRNYDDMEILGQTIDDAAGEAFDKCAKVMGLPYPGGPHIDRLAAEGDASRFRFAKPHIPYRQARQGGEENRREDRGHWRRRLGQFGCACGSCRLLQPSRPESVYPRTCIHYRQRRNGGDRRIFQISQRGVLPLRPGPIRQSRCMMAL